MTQLSIFREPTPVSAYLSEMATTTTQTDTIEFHELSSPAPWAQTQQTDHQASQPAEPTEPTGNQSSGKLDRRTLLKVASASFSFFVAGVNDGSVGAIIPHVIREYNVNTDIVSSV